MFVPSEIRKNQQLRPPEPGIPHVPPAVTAGASARDVEPPRTAKVEISRSRFALPHPGHPIESPRETIASKRLSHSQHLYSNSGIIDGNSTGDEFVASFPERSRWREELNG